VGKKRAIWRGVFDIDSINFGGGIDLKIKHEFLKYPGSLYSDEDFEYNNDCLNEEESFNISFLEIYQVL
jgi:hypothetical protein